MWAVEVVAAAWADVAETSGATLLTGGRVGGCWGWEKTLNNSLYMTHMINSFRTNITGFVSDYEGLRVQAQDFLG